MTEHEKQNIKTELYVMRRVIKEIMIELENMEANVLDLIVSINDIDG